MEKNSGLCRPRDQGIFRMSDTVIMMGNLGYLRGIDGSLIQHTRYAYRHFYCPPNIQETCLKQVRHIIELEDPDICCFVEIDKGSADLRNFNQLEALVSEKYSFFDIENKYGLNSRLRTFPLTRGKSNGFLSKKKYDYEKIYFTHGTKRLIYKITVAPNVTLFFAHFSLKKLVRVQQLEQVRQLIKDTPGDVIFLGDFNIHTGFGELAPLLHENNLVIMNKEDEPTFRFHKTMLPLDLCICSQEISGRLSLKIIPQPFSDHEALVLTLKN
jgi:endonuclease/exonuclease/phosphatase family metal-dependent hydrolase